MNEQNNPPANSQTVTSGKAAYKFMAAKKESPPVNEPEGITLSCDDTSKAESPDTTSDTNPGNPVRKKRNGTALNYMDTFLCRYELSSRQGLHLEKETIATIKRIIHSIGDERLTVSGFVENVLKHHFELYKEEVNRLYDEKLRKPIE